MPFTTVEEVLERLSTELGPTFTLAQLFEVVARYRGVPLQHAVLPSSVAGDVSGICLPLYDCDLILYGGSSPLTRTIAQLHEVAHLLFNDVPRDVVLPTSFREVYERLSSGALSPFVTRSSFCSPAPGLETRAEELATHLLRRLRLQSSERVSQWVG